MCIRIPASYLGMKYKYIQFTYPFKRNSKLILKYNLHMCTRVLNRFMNLHKFLIFVIKCLNALKICDLHLNHNLMGSTKFHVNQPDRVFLYLLPDPFPALSTTN